MSVSRGSYLGTFEGVTAKFTEVPAKYSSRQEVLIIARMDVADAARIPTFVAACALLFLPAVMAKRSHGASHGDLIANLKSVYCITIVRVCGREGTLWHVVSLPSCVEIAD